MAMHQASAVGKVSATLRWHTHRHRGPSNATTTGKSTMMTPVQILLVQTSFEMAGGDGTALAAAARQATDRAAGWRRRGHARQLAGRARAGGARSQPPPAAAARHAPPWRAPCRRLPVAQDAAFRRALLDALEEALGAALPTAGARGVGTLVTVRWRRWCARVQVSRRPVWTAPTRSLRRSLQG